MGGKPPKMDALTKGSDGNLEFASDEGDLILPSLDLMPQLKRKSVHHAHSVTLCVGINSNASNRGLGVVLNANPSLDVTQDERGLPNYAYNGYGLKHGVKGNAIKFHPGMSGGELRVEGVGGYGNSNMGYRPANW